VPADDDAPLTLRETRVMATITAPSRRFFHPLQRDAATFLETAEESGGTRTLIQIELAPGGGNAPHRHMTYAEHFEVLEGWLVVTLDDVEHLLGAGDCAVAPAGTLHNFRNQTSGTVVFRVELRPGHRGFERALQAGYGLAADGRTRPDGTPKNLYELAVLTEWSDIRISGPLRILQPIFGLLARRARAKGVDRRLAQRYVTL
jgi:mannose-6-phosphate isomerase-like protein (cupin superfamily)